MTNAPSAVSPTPWPAAAAGAAFAQNAEITYSCLYAGMSPMALWNLRLTIDETASPTARLTAECTAETAALVSAPRDPTWLLDVRTGYAGQAEARIFLGPITSVETSSDGTARIEAVSADYLLDTFPATTTAYQVGGAYTTFAAVIGDLQLAHLWNYAPLRATQIGSLTNPSSYTAFRQQRLEATDTILDFMIACGNARGNWIRGDQRGRASSGFVGGGTSAGAWDVSKLLISDRWDGGTPIDLNPITEKWTKRESSDDYADLLSITARYKSGGAEVTKTARYGSYIMTPPLTKSISVDYRAGAAFTAGTDPVAQAWANSYASRYWRITADCRAVWWLEPGHQATIGPETGTITKIEYQIDTGRMTIDLRPTVTWTPA